MLYQKKEKKPNTASAERVGWKADQLIFTENFESMWKSGGILHTTLSGKQMMSLHLWRSCRYQHRSLPSSLCGDAHQPVEQPGFLFQPCHQQVAGETR